MSRGPTCGSTCENRRAMSVHLPQLLVGEVRKWCAEKPPLVREKEISDRT